jgi:hypothetical protein
LGVALALFLYVPLKKISGFFLRLCVAANATQKDKLFKELHLFEHIPGAKARHIVPLRPIFVHGALEMSYLSDARAWPRKRAIRRGSCAPNPRGFHDASARLGRRSKRLDRRFKQVRLHIVYEVVAFVASWFQPFESLKPDAYSG